MINYTADLRAFLRWSERTNDASNSPLNLDTADIRAYRRFLRETKGNAPATINRKLQTLRKFYDFSTDLGWVEANPAQEVSLLSEVESDRSRSLTNADVSCLLAAVQASSSRWLERDWAIIQVLLKAGLKLGELAELRLNDVQLDYGEPQLNVAGSADGSGRTIPLEEDLCDALHSYLSTRQAAEGTEHFFVNRDGNPLSARSIQRLLQRYAEEADLEGLTTQALRYVYAKRVYEQCEDLETVARLLGHRHLATTIRYLRPSLHE